MSPLLPIPNLLLRLQSPAQPGSKAAASAGVNLPASSAMTPTHLPPPCRTHRRGDAAQLEERAKGKELNWKVSIRICLNCSKLDSSREVREELAKELNLPRRPNERLARHERLASQKKFCARSLPMAATSPKDLLD
ncbi:MAG: DUF3597 family protein [Anaerolineales bacterium]|nr:DUF3597 family protein [Anaerolineales bacterium]